MSLSWHEVMLLQFFSYKDSGGLEGSGGTSSKRITFPNQFPNSFALMGSRSWGCDKFQCTSIGYLVPVFTAWFPQLLFH